MAFEFSIVVPVFDRPEELEELLQSFQRQTHPEFEVIVVDDGSSQKSEDVAEKYKDQLAVQYFFKENTGPGDSRNFGCMHARSDFFVFFDSDCIVPDDYFAHLRRCLENADAFGGPDRSHASFTTVQKAINYSMTSLFTTGGIRGSKKTLEKFHPRSFNMGYSRKVHTLTGGFAKLRFGEDIDLSIRIFQYGFKSIFIPECYVYHKRRTDFKKFFKQVFNSGVARINLFKRHPGSLKFLHFFPAAFVLYQLLSIPHAIYHSEYWVLLPTLSYLLVILADALVKTKNPAVGLFSVWASVVQLTGYGLGFIKAFVKRIILGQPEFHDFDRTFYK